MRQTLKMMGSDDSRLSHSPHLHGSLEKTARTDSTGPFRRTQRSRSTCWRKATRRLGHTDTKLPAPRPRFSGANEVGKSRRAWPPALNYSPALRGLTAPLTRQLLILPRNAASLRSPAVLAACCFTALPALERRAGSDFRRERRLLWYHETSCRQGSTGPCGLAL